jgi:hypothetical protein
MTNSPFLECHFPKKDEVPENAIGLPNSFIATTPVASQTPDVENVHSDILIDKNLNS